MSHRPGMRYFPLPSTTRAPSGTPTSPNLPTTVIRSPVTTTVMSGRAGAPVASMTVTPVMASDFAGASSARAGSAPARATTVRQAVTCLIGPSGRCGEVGTDHDTTSGGAGVAGRGLESEVLHRGQGVLFPTPEPVPVQAGGRAQRLAGRPPRDQDPSDEAVTSHNNRESLE